MFWSQLWAKIWWTSWSESEQKCVHRMLRKWKFLLKIFWMPDLCILDNSISSFKPKLISVFVCCEYYFHTGAFRNEFFALCCFQKIGQIPHLSTSSTSVLRLKSDWFKSDMSHIIWLQAFESKEAVICGDKHCKKALFYIENILKIFWFGNTIWGWKHGCDIISLTLEKFIAVSEYKMYNY